MRWGDINYLLLLLLLTMWASRCGQTFDVAIFFGTINVINVQLCMMILLTEFYLLTNNTFSDPDHILWSQQYQMVLHEYFVYCNFQTTRHLCI